MSLLREHEIKVKMKKVIFLVIFTKNQLQGHLPHTHPDFFCIIETSDDSQPQDIFINGPGHLDFSVQVPKHGLLWTHFSPLSQHFSDPFIKISKKSVIIAIYIILKLLLVVVN